MKRCYYEVLGVEQDVECVGASTAVGQQCSGLTRVRRRAGKIKKAFYKQALEWHPGACMCPIGAGSSGGAGTGAAGEVH